MSHDEKLSDAKERAAAQRFAQNICGFKGTSLPVADQSPAPNFNDILSRIAVCRDHEPEEGETWESWYYAAFDMLYSEIRQMQKDVLHSDASFGVVCTPEIASIESQINSAVRVWLECPVEKRPSTQALGIRVAAIVALHSPDEAMWADDFSGDNERLIACIDATLKLDADNALVPHGLSNNSRKLLQAAAARLVHPTTKPEAPAVGVDAISLNGVTQVVYDHGPSFSWDECKKIAGSLLARFHITDRDARS